MDPVTGRDLNPEEPQDWESGIDKTATAHGWVCRTCFALLTAKPSHAQGHLAWHEANDGR